MQALLGRAAAAAGARLLGWRSHETEYGEATTVTCWAWLEWPDGRTSRELVGLVLHPDGARPPEDDTLPVQAGGLPASAWLHPHDPALPGLSRACRDDRVAALLHSRDLLPSPDPDAVRLEVVSYRPRRRAVVRVEAPGREYYLKVLRAGESTGLVARHALFDHSSVRVPRVLAHTDDHLVLLEGLPGDTLAAALVGDGSGAADPSRPVPCAADRLTALLDALPEQALHLPRRTTWRQTAGYGAELVGRLVPPLAARAQELAGQVSAGASTGPEVATHGDLHHGQLLVAGGAPVGLLDLDRLGPGHRADDLGCLVGQLVLDQALEERPLRGRALAAWLPRWEGQVGSRALRQAAAGVVLAMAPGLALGPRSLWSQQVAKALVAAEEVLAPGRLSRSPAAPPDRR